MYLGIFFHNRQLHVVQRTGPVVPVPPVALGWNVSMESAVAARPAAFALATLNAARMGRHLKPVLA